jgi:hypothetical protein
MTGQSRFPKQVERCMDGCPTATRIRWADLETAATPTWVQRRCRWLHYTTTTLLTISRVQSVEKHQDPCIYVKLLRWAGHGKQQFDDKRWRQEATWRGTPGFRHSTTAREAGSYYFWSHVSTPVQSQMTSNLSFKLAGWQLNPSGTEVCSNMSCLLLELACVQEKVTYSSTKIAQTRAWRCTVWKKKSN